MLYNTNMDQLWIEQLCVYGFETVTGKAAHCSVCKRDCDRNLVSFGEDGMATRADGIDRNALLSDRAEVKLLVSNGFVSVRVPRS